MTISAVEEWGTDLVRASATNGYRRGAASVAVSQFSAETGARPRASAILTIWQNIQALKTMAKLETGTASPGYKNVLRAASPDYQYIPRAASPDYQNVNRATSSDY